MKKIKIKVVENHVVMVVPYKNGYVEWIMIWNKASNTYRYVVGNNIPDYYHPRRVERAHKEFLMGKNVKRRIMRSLAATHSWHLLDRFKTANIIVG